MEFIIIISFLFFGFLGYLIGRWGDNYLIFWMGDTGWTPDHWIYGFLLIPVGFYFFDNPLSWYITFFGLGILISDLKDFLNLKFYGSDGKTKETRRFWAID